MAVIDKAMNHSHHSILPSYSHDDISRNLFSSDLSIHINKEIYLKCYNNFHYDLPKQISSRRELTKARKSLLKKNSYKFWSSLKRINQEILFDNIGIVIHKQQNRFQFNLTNKKLKFGKIKLIKGIHVPKYLTNIDIHCMPGGYLQYKSKDDFSVGTLYDSSLYLYSKNSLGTYNDDMGNSVCLWLKNNLKSFQPKKILDMGCGIGNNTIPYKKHYTNSEVYGIDISAPILKYAYIRSNILRENIYFQQQNAERTNFKENSFDLIVSHLLTHETSYKGFYNIIYECRRLLKNNGIMLHIETDWNTEKDLFNKLTLDWETHYNAEPFKTAHDSIDKYQLAIRCGFSTKHIFMKKIDSLSKSKYYNGKWSIFGAVNKI